MSGNGMSGGMSGMSGMGGGTSGMSGMGMSTHFREKRDGEVRANEAAERQRDEKESREEFKRMMKIGLDYPAFVQYFDKRT